MSPVLYGSMACTTHAADDPKTGQAQEAGETKDSGAIPAWVGPLVIGSLVTGLGAALANIAHSARLERQRRKAGILDAQVRNLYGPLHFFASCNQQISAHTWKVHEAAQKEYSGPHCSPARTEKIDATINVNNKYFAETSANNKRMVEILRNHHALIEPDDVEVFAGFLMDCLRSEIEFDPAGPRLPLEIYARVGDIYTIRPDVMELIDRRFKQKKADLERLSR